MYEMLFIKEKKPKVNTLETWLYHTNTINLIISSFYTLYCIFLF